MSTKRSYKAEFLRWKAEVEKKHGKMIYDRLSEVIDTDDDLPSATRFSLQTIME